MSNLTLGSLFDGSGGFPLGAIMAGITPIWSSEIEPFPIRVTEKRLPSVKHYGDIGKLDGAKLPPVDIITFGSPCQDLSIAGKRDGLGGERSGLFHEAVRIVKEMREATDGKKPRYIVWENVTGAFSSNKGEDFRCVLEEICQVKEAGIHIPGYTKWAQAGEIVGDGFSVCYRTFDAQYWGVPQRRKRIYLVADFAGRSASKILFESEGVSGYSPQSFRAWQGIAGSTAEGAGKTGDDSIEDYNVPFLFENHSQDTRYRGPLKTAQTVSSTYGTGGNNQPFVVQTPKALKIRCGCEGGGKGALIQDNRSATLGCNNDQTLFQPKVYGICAKNSNSMKSDNPDSGFYEASTSRCLDGNGGNPSCNQGGMAVVAIEDNGSRPSHHGDGYSEENVSYTLNTIEKHGVAYGLDRASFNQGRNALFDFAVEEELEPTIVAKGPGAVAQMTYSASKASFFTEAAEEKANTLVATDYKDPPIVNDAKDKSAYGFYPQMKAECVTFTEETSGCLVNGTNPGYQNGVLEEGYVVRRLTPVECARLQGFPDNWCSALESEEPDETEIEKWKEIFTEYAEVTGTKVKSDAQIIKWLKSPYSDSAAYKMWGNGVALPNVYFVLSGIVWADECI